MPVQTRAWTWWPAADAPWASERSNDPGMPVMLRVLLVEDSKLLAERVREELDQVPDVEVVGTADTEVAAVTMARERKADAMILDLQLRVGTGFGVLRALGKECPPVIVLTNFSLPAYAARARELGVEQFLDKQRDFDGLPAAIALIKTNLGL